jgi:hypothetical protein
MKNIIRAVGITTLFLSVSFVASANISPAAGAPETPAAEFTFFCSPYTEPLAAGGAYTFSLPNTNCTYTLPQLSPTKVIGLFKGTPGNATTLQIDSTGSDVSTQLTDPNAFDDPQNGDAFFVASWGATNFTGVITGEGYLQTGEGTPPAELFVIPFTWAGPTTASLTVTADDKSIVYGSPLPEFTATLSGFVNEDTQESNDTSGEAQCSTTATAGSPVGDYPITCTLGTLASANDYTFDSFVAGVLHITPAPLTVSADEKTSVYGASIPALTASISGFVNGDTLGVVSGLASCTSTATAGSPVGEYPITCTQGTLAATNYTFEGFADGELDITRATLTVKADDKTMNLGGVLPTFTSTINGFVNGDTLSVVSGAASCGTTATGATVGAFSITCTQGTLAVNNYNFSFTPGTLKVLYFWNGFLQPINDTAHQTGQDLSVFKAGSTVPVKLQLKDAAGNVLTTATPPIWLTPQKGAPMSSTVDELYYSDPVTTDGTFDFAGDHYKYNWGTQGLQAGFWYRIYVLLPDGSVRSVTIGLR